MSYRQDRRLEGTELAFLRSLSPDQRAAVAVDLTLREDDGARAAIIDSIPRLPV